MERLDQIISIIRNVGELTLSKDLEITGDTDIRTDIGFDSLDMVMIVDELEETFGITVENDMVQEIKTVNDLCRKVSGLLGE